MQQDQKQSNEERVKALSDLYARAREKIRAAGGMKTSKQAIKEIIHENRQNCRQALEEMIAAEEDEGNRAVLHYWKNLPPRQIVNEIDIAIASYLKRVQRTDPDFVLFKNEHHRKNPAEFDALLQDLKRKGLM